MIKPTPTILPPATPRFVIPPQYSLWASTDYTVQSWNLLGDARVVIQVIFVVALIIVGAYVLTKSLRAMTRQDSEG